MYDLIKQEAISTTNEPAYNYYLRECPDVKEKEFVDWYNDIDNYRPELPSNNRSHKY